jgi:hypothetical protein
MLQKLKERWGVNNAFQVVIILVVFACTGFTVMFMKKPLYALAGISETTPAWVRVFYYSFTILPAYQVILLAYGFIFGQFRFFWEFEKRMFKGIGKIFKKSKPKVKS